MGTASSDCLSRQFRVLHPQSLNRSVCTQKNEEPIIIDHRAGGQGFRRYRRRLCGRRFTERTGMDLSPVQVPDGTFPSSLFHAEARQHRACHWRRIRSQIP
jgi:hypothetical protein